MPPLAPMLGRVVRQMPRGDYVYEPKWDGFRCVAFRDGDDVDLRSRHDRPFSRYFPEVAAALRDLDAERVVLDGELVVNTAEGPDFAALMARLHPAASRVELLAGGTPADYVVFDVVALGGDDLRPVALHERRAILERVLRSAPERVRLSPQTDDHDAAQRWLELPPRGIDGVMAKERNSPTRQARAGC